MVNEELGGYLAATHLLDQGARRLVYLAGFLQLHAISGRLKGIRRAVAEVEASLDVVEAPNLKIDQDASWAAKYCNRGGSTASSVRPIRWRSASSRRRPILTSDLLVIGYDDDHFASESSPGLHGESTRASDG
jgi:LacI family transcriptional regulator